jgi:ankyrin repeat protein
MWLCIQSGRTPLHYACENGLKDVALMLIERGANATEKDEVRVMTDDS